MSTLNLILISGFLMSLLAFIGGLTFFFNEKKLKKSLHFFIALAAGTLLGGALFHLLPSALQKSKSVKDVFLFFVLGFMVLLIMEQLLLWQSKKKNKKKRPLGYLILIADGIHNFIGGIGISAVMMSDHQLGLTAWGAALLHELPQELGDFGILVDSGWRRKDALMLNFLSALTFPLGGVLVYFLSNHLDVGPLVPFAAGNFVYISSSGLIPEIKKHTEIRHALLNFFFFSLGITLLYLLGE